MKTVTREQLAADLTPIANDAEDLLTATAEDAGAHLGAMRERLEKSLVTARARVVSAEEAVVAQSKAAARATDKYVHANPWPSIGIAAAAGVLIGLLARRR